MANELADQLNTIERSLGECMIETASTVIRMWLNELGENNPYEQALLTIRKTYNDLFTKWLNVDDPDAEAKLNKITGDAYQLADAVYVDIRLKRGLSPQMHGFSRQSPESILRYFDNCIRLQSEDLEWLREAMNNEEQVSSALVAIMALARNLRECFSIDAFTTLIDGMASENDVVADLCTANVLTLLIHYDVRIDFFPQIQETFINTVTAMGDQGDHVFEVLCAFVESSKKNWLEDYAMGMLPLSWLPKEIQKLVESVNLENAIPTLQEWAPKEETKYMEELVTNLPNTWLYEVLVNGNPMREKNLAFIGLQCGYRDMLWNNPDVGERVYRDILRNGSDKPQDFINYAHCLMLKGDRMMAYENYKQARQICGSLRDFYDLFRPDRRALIDHGVPLDYVYALEDNLVNG